MPCYHPIPGWMAKKRNEGTGRRSIVFNLNDGFVDRPVPVPCGNCVGCRLEKARQWAVRCSHEAQLWDENSFVTLTYEDGKVPVDGSLRPEDFVNFMKRLRNEYGPGVRFFQCGEYGEKMGRPHHHALLFNCGFPDKVPLQSFGENPLWRSPLLEKLWGHGFCSIGEVTFESAGYIARYTLKKVTGAEAEYHYNGKVPEYLTMSRRPGIGAGWLDKFGKDVYPSDELVVNGKISKPPRYYDDRMSKVAPDMVARIKAKRLGAAKADEDGSQKRLNVREIIKEAAIVGLKRGMENGSEGV